MGQKYSYGKLIEGPKFVQNGENSFETGDKLSEQIVPNGGMF